MLFHPYEFFNSTNDYQKQIIILEKEDFFSKLENDYPSSKEIKRPNEIFEVFKNRNGEEFTNLDIKSDDFLLTCVIEEFIKVAINEFEINRLNSVSLPGFT